MSLVLQSSGGGSVTLQEAVTASNLTITVPAVTGTMLTTETPFSNGQGPAFSAKLSADQTGVAQGTWTKLQLATEVFDTNNNFDSTTNYRFTPTVAGYYLITANIGFANDITGQMVGAIYKNGSSYNVFVQTVGQITNPAFTGSNTIYMNGSTDYIELYGFIDSANARGFQSEGGIKSWMTGFLARAA